MTLYHFCPAFMKDSILADGLTKGKFPLLGDGHFTFIDKIQWLTAEPDPRLQSWNTSHLINYSRTAYRLTINIPGSYHKKLIKAADYVKDLPDKAKGIVTDWPGSDKWYIFAGKIPAKWIVGCHRMEEKRC